MIFFDNCCTHSEDRQSLSIFRQLGHFLRPPALFRVLLLVIFLSISITANAVQVTLNLKAVPLETAFHEIKKQTGYGFWYEKKYMTDLPRVTIGVKNADLIAVLDACLKGQPLSYQIFDKTIVVKRKGTATSTGNPVKKAIQEKVKGKVVDAQTKEPLAGVLVKVKSPAMSVVTNDKGEFELILGEGKFEVIVQFIGYGSKELTVSSPNGDVILIAIGVVENALEEVRINAGYYNVKERDRTGSIVRIDSKTIEKQNVNSPLLALQGNVAGLQVTQTTGVPGGAVSVQVRGRSSLNVLVGNDPLYVVDGVIFPSTRISSSTSNSINGGAASPLAMISPSELESIEVLKDADATAIYGARGANGVILITTKKGRSGKAQVYAAISSGYSQVGRKLKLMDTEQYLQMRMEAFKNDGLNPTALDYDVNGIWDKDKYTDWQEVLIGRNGGLTNTELNVTGGSNNFSYRIAGNFYKEDTVFPGDFSFNRGGVSSTLNLGGAEDRLKMAFVLGYTRSQNTTIPSDITSFITMAPNYPDLYDENGKLNWQYKNTPMPINPMASLQSTINSKTDNLVGNININYRMMENLYFRTSLGYNVITREELSRRPLTALSPATNPTPLNRQSWFGNNLNNSWILEPQLNYQRNIWKGKLDGLIGMTFQGNDTKFQNISATGFNSDDLMNDFGNAATISRNETSNSQYRYIALFARINYNLLGRYLINLTARGDGSSRFGPGKQFANFGAIGGAWIFSDESWMRDRFPFLSLGKIRGSYGITGNDQIPDYGYLQFWTSAGAGSYQGISALTINRLSNTDYAWEKTKKIELALQLGLFRDRLNFEIAFFRNRTSNQLLLNPLPPSVGSTGLLVNIPAEVENRGWELQGLLNAIKSANWSWNIGFNLSLPKNKLLSYPDLQRSSNRLNYRVGEPLTIRQVYNTSVDPLTGNYIFEDYDKSGTRNDADRYLTKFIGQQFYGGLNNSLRFKWISLDFLFSFTKQTGNNYMRGITYAPGFFSGANGFTNQPVDVLDRWTANGDLGRFQKFSTTSASWLGYVAARGDGGLSVTDASFIRLRSLSLGFQVPKDFTGKIGIANAQLVLQGQNLLTITGYQGLDPESQSLANLPPLRAISVGVKLTF